MLIGDKGTNLDNYIAQVLLGLGCQTSIKPKIEKKNSIGIGNPGRPSTGENIGLLGVVNPGKLINVPLPAPMPQWHPTLTWSQSDVLEVYS